MEDPVLVEHRDGITIITINRPQAKNAVNRAVTLGIAAAVDELEARPEQVLGILTGAGGTFCAGMDLKAFVAGENVSLPVGGLGGICRRPPGKPLIAAVVGWALAGGCEIALACDLIVAANDAKFGIPEVKRGLVAGAGGLLRLPRRLPQAIAMELALTGDAMEAVDAHRYGLVNALTPPGGALAGALALAARISGNAPLAVAPSREILTRATDWTMEQGFIEQEVIYAPVIASADARDSALAFAEKRPPIWQGR